MARKSYVQINGVLYDKDELAQSEGPRGPMVAPDLPDFVSPIDGKLVSGRAGLREHCKQHRVVPNQELVGLPPLLMHHELPKTYQEREETKRVIGQVISERGYFKGR